ncbi:Patatin [Candidatus Tenderia electrophaga]|jgi:NTE family protein|uniref:Patatin n=1 Tax=Candidatus Tenderia electrophaga TaxID=1748243 RepID=A0A0S2TH36_9GAMM|nr:Patatin [Candidatus Tenderia electrophaga]
MAWRVGSQQAQPRVGLILAGGGARAAYQVGVLKAIARMRAPAAVNPFPVLCGTSAGAINAAALAIYSADFQNAVSRLVSVWGNFTVDKVFRSDFWGIASSGAHWFAALMLGGVMGRYNPSSLFDRTPLQQLLSRYMPFEQIGTAIEAGHVHALSITASGYTTGQSVTFYQSAEPIEPWDRAIRVGCPAQIGIEHLMASSAIPFLFEAIKINREYFGDGSMRQIAPISPALHLGAGKLLVIGVRGSDDDGIDREKIIEYPSMAQIAGHALNSIFLDSMEVDLERLQRINRTLETVPKKYVADGTVSLKPVETLVISPSRDISKIAQQHSHHLPRTVRYFLRGLGALNRDGTSLLSYLLFEKAFCRELIALGYADTIKRREEITTFLDAQ